jgi:hypothetical protein
VLAAMTDPIAVRPGEEPVHIMEVLPNGFTLLPKLQGIPLPRIVQIQKARENML